MNLDPLARQSVSEGRQYADPSGSCQ